MLNFLFRKILSSLVTLFLLATMVYFLVQVIMPGDYVSMFLGMSIEDKEFLRQQLGLDLPVWRQYLLWLGSLLGGGLGRSFSGVPVTSAVLASLPNTLLVFLTGGALAFFLGNWLGKSTAWQKRRMISEGTALTVTGLYAFFPPALAFLLGHFLVDQLGWFPSEHTFWYLFERDYPDVNIGGLKNQMVISLVFVSLVVVVCGNLLYRWRRVRLPMAAFLPLVAAGWLGSWVALGIAGSALRILHFAALPILAFTLLTMGEMSIISSTSLAETIHEEYVTTARAKGLSEAAVRDRHAARNALLPVISKVVVSLPYLIAGLAIIEYSLNWPGLGSAVFYSTQGQDVPMALGYLLFIGIFAMGARLLLELIYLFLDPRMRTGLQEVKGT
jgi:peptide/nickel transport system permease protein